MVIAIIGILSSVVLVSMGGSRDKARIARTQADLDAFRQALNLYWNDNGILPCPRSEGIVSACLLIALNPYAKLPSIDPWGNNYQWHNPDVLLWPSECTMILSRGPNKVMCGSGSDVGCEHSASQTSACNQPSASYDDIGIYFGLVGDNQ